MPIRIQRKRVKGWRMPEGAVYVGRPTRWGNPYVVGRDGDALGCVVKYRRMWIDYLCEEGAAERLKRNLRGKNLACWCALHEPCHADVLLELANGNAGFKPE